MRKLLLGAALAVALNASANADETSERTVAKDHAPIGVMGDHMHKKGEMMFSYRFMRMEMSGNRIGTDAVSPDEIVTTIPNRFFGSPMQPPTLRVVPLEMSMNMHMLGAMYAPADWVTLMAMGTLVGNDMDHVTYQGGMGAAVLGGFTTETFGIGDTKVSALVRLFDQDGGGVRHHAHLNLGVSIPTGSTTETGQILTPMGMTPSPRLPYPMQLGSGTFDLQPGVTYAGGSEAFSWGAQYLGTFRTGTNDEGYSLSDKHEATAWAQYGPAPWVAFSGRVAFHSQSGIDGIDPAIVAPVQTADPDFQGGERLEIGAGVNFAVQHGVFKGNRFEIEAMAPVYQNLNGPQLETGWALTAGWQKAF
ncbi:transporter [Hyphococcus sp.]|uniref:transporter n=1 Tax=Hyphococcus sp. TaxID=2038636 RepID=UPI0037520BC9